MDRYGCYFKTLLYSSLLFILSGSVVLAELTLESVYPYPAIGKLGEPLEVTLTGTGFDANTRVSVTLDVGNKRSILGSIGVPGDAQDVCVVGDIAYVADYDLQIFRIGTTNPPSIELISTLVTPGDAVAVTVVGNMAYMADGLSGLQIIDVANPENPVFIDGGHWSVEASENSEAWDVAVAGQIAYVAYGISGLQVIDVYNPSTPVFSGKFDTYDDGRKVNALGVTVVDGKAYVADNGWDKGLLIVDTNDPGNLTEKGDVILGDAYGVTVADNIAYVADGENGLQIIDVTDSQNPVNIGAINTPGWADDVTVVERIENVDDPPVIKKIAYVADGPGGLQIIDVTNPENPDNIGSVDDPGSAWGISVVGDRAYVAHSISLLIVDVSKPALPEIIAAKETSYDDIYGDHIVGHAMDIELVGDLAFLAAAGLGLQMFNVFDPKNPVLLNTWPTNGPWGVEIVGDIAYLADWDTFHLIELSTSDIIDIKPPLPTEPTENFGVVGVTVVDKKAYVAWGESGLQVVDVDQESPNYLYIIGSWKVDTPPNPDDVTAPWDVAIADNKAYIAYGESGLQVIAIQPDPIKEGYLKLDWIGSLDTEDDDARSITLVSNDRAYLTSGNQLQVIDTSAPAEPITKKSLELQDFAYNLTVDGDKAYVAVGASGLQVIDISDHDNPKPFGLVETLGEANDVAVSDSIAYVADGGGGLVIVPLPLELEPEGSLPPWPNSVTEIDLTLPPPKVAGHYSLRVFNDIESDEIPGAVTFLTPEDYQQQRSGKKAIIVAGYLSTADRLWDETRQAANMAYLALHSQGYKGPDWDNIYYLSPEATDVDGDDLNDVKAAPSISNLSDAITWGSDSDELLLFMVDHGGSGTFQLNSNDILNAGTLDELLDSLQSEPIKVRIIYDACYSGSFIPLLLPPPGKDRIVVTSSLEDEKAWFLDQGALSFSYQFWAHIFLDGSLAQAFNTASSMMRYHQDALIDANGNGIPNEKTDVISDIVIGIGRIAASTPPHIGRVSPEQTLSGERSSAIWAKDIISLNPVSSVWAVIIPPLYRSPDYPDLPVTDSDLEPRPLSDPDEDGTWEVTHHNFLKTGTYQVLVYAKDNDGNISLPRQTTIIQNAGIGCGGDLDSDDDADGLDLLYYPFNNQDLALEQFASDFGKTECAP